MLLLFAFRVAEWPPVWKGALRSVNRACLSRTFINFVRVLLSLLVLRVDAEL